MDWSTLSKQLQTGDVLLFHNTSFISRLIELITESRFSHVAMIIRDGDTVQLWQSYEPTGGVSLAPLPAFLQGYFKEFKGVTFYYRQLQVDRTQNMMDALASFQKEVNGRPFVSIWGMLENWIAGKLGKDTGETSFDCSELVADTYMHMGLLPLKPPHNYYAPKNFASDQDLDLQLGATLTPLQQFTLD